MYTENTLEIYKHFTFESILLSICLKTYLDLIKNKNGTVYYFLNLRFLSFILYV